MDRFGFKTAINQIAKRRESEQTSSATASAVACRAVSIAVAVCVGREHSESGFGRSRTNSVSTHLPPPRRRRRRCLFRHKTECNAFKTKRIQIQHTVHRLLLLHLVRLRLAALGLSICPLPIVQSPVFRECAQNQNATRTVLLGDARQPRPHQRIVPLSKVEQRVFCTLAYPSFGLLRALAVRPRIRSLDERQ